MKRSREERIESGDERPEPGALNYTTTDEPVAKLVQLDFSNETDSPATTMQCSLPPHKETLSFGSYEEWETHYTKAHMNRCLECRKNFPSPRLLDVHIEDWHDSFVAVKRERGEHTYSCFVEDCDRKCRTYQKRRMHLIDKHMYPRNYFFAVTKEGIDGRRNLLVDSHHHRRHSSNVNTNKTSSPRTAPAASTAEPASKPTTVHEQPGSKSTAADSESSDEDAADSAMEELTGAMSSLQFVPHSIRFGRGGRAGFPKR